MAAERKLYNLDELRAIPILDVCSYLGLDVQKRGRNYWCKVRNESKPSVILHTDTNYFYDFGSGEHGNNIALVQYARGGIQVGKAIRELAQAFHIAPSESREEALTKPLNMWEYSKIGLYGDMATKNFVFPVTSASIDELLEMEYAYRMPMNQLRTKEPEVYRQILETKAIPFVENKRDRYYMSVWNHYCFLRMLGQHVLFFDSERTAMKFDMESKDLAQSERALYKACLGTGISFPPQQLHDPQRILSNLLRGTLTFSLGNASLAGVSAVAEETQCGTCSKMVSYDDYCNAALEDHTHSAVFRSGMVELIYPDSDKEFYEGQFTFPRKNNLPLDAVISDAKARKSKASAHTNMQPEPVR